MHILWFNIHIFERTIFFLFILLFSWCISPIHGMEDEEKPQELKEFDVFCYLPREIQGKILWHELPKNVLRRINWQTVEESSDRPHKCFKNNYKQAHELSAFNIDDFDASLQKELELPEKKVRIKELRDYVYDQGYNIIEKVLQQGSLNPIYFETIFRLRYNPRLFLLGEHYCVLEKGKKMLLLEKNKDKKWRLQGSFYFKDNIGGSSASDFDAKYLENTSNDTYFFKYIDSIQYDANSFMVKVNEVRGTFRLDVKPHTVNTLLALRNAGICKELSQNQQSAE